MRTKLKGMRQATKQTKKELKMHRGQIKERKRDNSLRFLPDPTGPDGRKRHLRRFGEKSGTVSEMPGILPLT